MSILHWLGKKKKAPLDGTVLSGHTGDARPTAEALLRLAREAQEQGNLEVALDYIAQAIQADPSGSAHLVDMAANAHRMDLFSRAALNAGIALIDANRWEDAQAALLLATRIVPDWAPPYVNLAYLELSRGRAPAAIALYRKAIELDPAAPVPRSYLLFALNMTDEIGAEQNFLEHRRFGEWLAATKAGIVRDYSNARDPERTLRVGYVSGDYRVHPVAQFLEPLLGDHDPSQVTFVCYSNTSKRDEQTAAFERLFAHHWRDICSLSDDEVVDVVLEDQIDILVDLSGHTGDSRLGVFARKPAPVQVAWLGYLNTTGLRSIDYRIVDWHTDPVGVSDARSVERLVRLPDSQWAYWPVIEMPLLPRKKVREAGRVVFGSQNQYAKISDGCIELWARILARLPDARVRVAGLPPAMRTKDVVERFERFGIGPDRVDAAPRVPIKQYLEALNEIDIALDAMPYSGATTALDTLWMGVPVVALAGDRSISRSTYSILKTLGRDDLIARTPDEYVDLNVRLATDVEWRGELHRTLREQVRRSPLMDITRFAENLEAAYRTMWREWCATSGRGA